MWQAVELGLVLVSEVVYWNYGPTDSKSLPTRPRNEPRKSRRRHACVLRDGEQPRGHLAQDADADERGSIGTLGGDVPAWGEHAVQELEVGLLEESLGMWSEESVTMKS